MISDHRQMNLRIFHATGLTSELTELATETLY